MLNEYQRELLNEIVVELSNMRDYLSVNDTESYLLSEDRIKLIVKILKSE